MQKRRYSPESQRRRFYLMPAALVLLAIAVSMQTLIEPLSKQYHINESNSNRALGGLNNEFLLLPLLGFREAAAGLLWVRCDEFFHSGDYDAILPLVRLITWLDPHADNVYVTGAWHLSYNFTDSSERSDRRYIAPSEKLLDEGIVNNPNIPDIKFEKGWENFDKIKDFIAAEKAFKQAIATKPDKSSQDWPYGAPLKTLHILAHTYEKQGRIPEALDEWNQALARSAEMMKRDPKDSPTLQLRRAEQHNHDETLQRYRDRYTTSGHDDVNPSPYPAVLLSVTGPKQYKMTGPWDVAFQPALTVVRPKVLKVTGVFNSAPGARVDVRITDWNYQERPIANASDTFDINYHQTILVDQVSVRNDKIERELDMSKDPKMYGFWEPYYRVVLSYNARTTSPHLHDRFGWSGEGLTDSNPSHVVMDPEPLLLGTKLIDGQGAKAGPVWDGTTVPWGLPLHPALQPPRLIKVTYKISKAQILDQKSITSADIVPNE